MILSVALVFFSRAAHILFQKVYIHSIQFTYSIIFVEIKVHQPTLNCRIQSLYDVVVVVVFLEFLLLMHTRIPIKYHHSYPFSVSGDVLDIVVGESQMSTLYLIGVLLLPHC